MQYLIPGWTFDRKRPVSAVIDSEKGHKYEFSIYDACVTEMQVIPVAGHDSMLMNLRVHTHRSLRVIL